MADTSSSEKQLVLDVAELLDEHRAEDTTVLDVRENCAWTDYFVITTARSHTHIRALVGYLHEFFRDHDIEALNGYKHPPDNGWVLIDCGSFVIHLMDSERREFYELERLWFSSERLYHSSKSS